jgi:threonine dehydrogenase-like Zn-dependent dehydrogenase
LLYRDVTLRSVFSHRESHARQAARLIERAADPFASMVTHTYPLAEAERAVRVAARLESDGPDPIKVAIEP